MVIDDLFFVSKVQSPLIALGLHPRSVTTRPDLAAYLQTVSTPVLMIVDLTLRSDDALAMIHTLRASAQGATVMAQKALAAGATKVVAKSILSQHFVELVQALLPPMNTPQD
jgi:ActR/RegA family two-component response regulator